MSSDWHYTTNGQQHGPISAASFKQLVASGGLVPDDLVWQEGMPSWVPAKHVRGIFPSSAPGSDSTPPPMPKQRQSQAPAPRTTSPSPTITPPPPPVSRASASTPVQGVGNAIRGVADSEQVKAAGQAVGSAVSQAVSGAQDFVRSDAVQARVRAAKGVWSSLTPQHKIIAACIGGVGLLLMFCVVGSTGSWMFGGAGGRNGDSSQRSSGRAPTSGFSGRSSGQWTMEQVNSIKGFETPEEVIAILGKPDSQDRRPMGNGKEMLVFRYKAERRPDEIRSLDADPNAETSLTFFAQDDAPYPGVRLRSISNLRHE